MTNEQYAEIINRATQNLLNSRKDYKKVYNSDTHGTKTEYIKVKQTGDKYETGLEVLGENTTNSNGEIKPGLDTFVLDDEGNKVREEIIDPETGEITYGDYKTMPDASLLQNISNTALALTIAYTIAREVDPLLTKINEQAEEIKKLVARVSSLEEKIKNLNLQLGVSSGNK